MTSKTSLALVKIIIISSQKNKRATNTHHTNSILAQNYRVSKYLPHEAKMKFALQKYLMLHTCTLTPYSIAI